MSTEQHDLAYALAKNVVKVNYDVFSAKDIEVTKRCFLDTLGVSLAASTLSPGSKEVIELVKEGGGKKESSILAFGGKVPAWMAAFANGALCHALDYDDLHHTANMHPSITTFPAALAAAERVGKVSGKELITALALGNDLACRMGLSINQRPKGWKFDWLPHPVVGHFSAAATAGKLLGLDEEEMVDAFGIALHQSAGTMELGYSTGTMVRGMYPSFAGKGGVLSAMLAQKGITGTRNAFEGKAGFYNVYFEGEFDRASLTEGLGRRFEGTQTGFKAWPACGATHPYIDATLGLVIENDIQPQEIEEIVAVVGDFSQTLCQPQEGRRKPKTTMDAKFSIPFTVAVAAAKRKVALGAFTPEGLKDRAVLRMAQKVTSRFDGEISFAHGVGPGVIEIKTKSGKLATRRVDKNLGSLENPLSKEDLAEKFRDCASYSVKPLSKKIVDKVIDMVDKLDEVDDVRNLIKIVS